jgi:hypothetical protein
MRIKTLSKAYYKGTKSLDGVKYAIQIHWNTYTEKWYMNIKGLSNDVDIKGIALLPGRDLFAPYGYSAQLGELWVTDNTSGDENPNFDDMGTRWTLEYTPLG